MTDLIISYLYKNKKCPLPSVGSLHIIDANAVSLFGEVKIAAPVPVVQFSTKEMPCTHLINYITTQKNISVDDAIARLNEYCKMLKEMDADAELPLGNAGKFYMNAGGTLQFKQAEIPVSFMPMVTAQRIIHPNDSHKMLVGDTQTTNTVMSEFFNEEEIRPVKRWWIWAILLFVLVAVLLVIYYNDKNRNAAFGNAQSYTVVS